MYISTLDEQTTETKELDQAAYSKPDGIGAETTEATDGQGKSKDTESYRDSAMQSSSAQNTKPEAEDVPSSFASRVPKLIQHLTSSDGLLTLQEKRSSNCVHECNRGSIYLEMIEDCLFLHTLLFDLRYPAIRYYLAMEYLLEVELMKKGVGVLGCFVENDTQIRFAEMFDEAT